MTPTIDKQPGNPADPPLKLAACYIRVSTEDQVELSPDSQMAEIRKFCQREGYVLAPDHIYIDAGISGRKADKRPEFQRMIATAKSKDPPFHTIIVWKFSRFARNQEESIFYKNILRSKCGVDVVSVSEPIMAGPFGSLIERIIEWMDEFYSIRLSQEVKRSMTVNAQRGAYQSRTPFGYRYVDKHPEPVEDEAEAVRYIYTSYVNGLSLREICEELTSRGYVTRTGKTFGRLSLRYILHNPFYIGKVRWTPEGRKQATYTNANPYAIVVDGTHQPIISQELWDRAQARNAAIREVIPGVSPDQSKVSTWLKRLIRCSACGYTYGMTGSSRLRCVGNSHCRCSVSQTIRVDVMENAVLARLKEDLQAAASTSVEVTPCQAEEPDYDAKLQSLRAQLRRVQDAYVAGVMDLDTYSRNYHDITARMESVQAEAEAYEPDDPLSRVAGLRDSVASLIDNLSSDLPAAEKNRIASSIIDRIVLDQEARTFTIIYRKAVVSLPVGP